MGIHLRSLRGRLLLAVVAMQMVILVLFCGGLYLSLRAAIRRDFDRVLTAKAREITAVVEQDKDGVTFETDPQLLLEYNRGVDASRRPDFFQVWLVNGSVLVRSPSLGQRNLLATPPLSETKIEIRDTILPDGRLGRLIILPFVPLREQDGPEAVPASMPSTMAFVVVARDFHQFETVTTHLQVLLSGLGLAATLMSAAALWLVTHKTFRPVNNMALQIAAIREEELNTLVASDNAPSEFVPIVEKLNGLLTRLHAAFDRERGFSADVAHELRNPLTALRTTLEVCRSRPRDPQNYEASIDKSLVLIDRMELIVENLLMLSRAEAHQLAIHREPFHFNTLLAECWTEVEPIALQRQLTCKREPQDSLVVETDTQKLRLILQNLFDNAAIYTNEGGQIEWSVTHENNQAVLLNNTGSTVRPEDVVHLCDRFWRADKARASTGLHCGLGLAIVRRLTTLLGLSMAITAEENGWFRVELRVSRGRRFNARLVDSLPPKCNNSD